MDKEYVIQVKMPDREEWGVSYWAAKTYNLEHAKVLMAKLETTFGFETRLMTSKTTLKEVK
jgi:hypothetical protein